MYSFDGFLWSVQCEVDGVLHKIMFDYDAPLLDDETATTLVSEFLEVEFDHVHIISVEILEE